MSLTSTEIDSSSEYNFEIETSTSFVLSLYIFLPPILPLPLLSTDVLPFYTNMS